MNETLPVIRTFWYGPRLNFWAHACLKSFALQGHDVVVYAYSDLDLPRGVRREDAAQVLPESDVFFYEGGEGRGSVSAFTNQFRYAMLHRFGGYWVDTDVICQKPFPAFDRFTVGREDAKGVGSAILYSPPGEPLLDAAFREARALGSGINWGQVGPALVTRLAFSGDYDVSILDQGAFYPVDHQTAVEDLLLPENAARVEAACRDSYGVHLCNEVHRRAGIDTGAMPPRGSFLERRLTELAGDVARGQETPRSVRSKLLKYRIGVKYRMVRGRFRPARNLVARAVKRSGLVRRKPG